MSYVGIFTLWELANSIDHSFFFNFSTWSITALQCCVSAVQQCESVICVHISPPSQASTPHPTHTDYHRELSWAPCAIQSFPLATYFTHGSIYLLLFSHSVVFDSLWPHGLQHARLPSSFTISHSLLKLMSIESVMPSNHLVLCRPLLLLPFPASESFLMSQFFILGG